MYVLLCIITYECIPVIDNENTSTYNDGNATYYINAIFKSTVILPCHLKLNHSKPTWLQNQLALASKVHM